MPGFSETFEDTIQKGLHAYFLGKPGSCLALLALSGGADSTSMTAAMAALRDRGGQFELHALHVNHGIRPPDACAVDEKTAAELCNRLKIPFTVKKIPPGTIKAYARQYGTGVEGAARYFRYQALREEAEQLGANAIVTAHTADDRLETILMAFLRGSGPAGLGALSDFAADLSDFTVVSSLVSGSGMVLPILRPLLPLSRMDVLAYVKERNLGYCSDETNEDQRFFRNKIRRGLIHFLDDQFPYWRETVLRLGDTQAMTAAFLKEAAKKNLQWKIESNERSAGLKIFAEQFFSQPAILREEALFLAMDRLMENESSGKRPRRDALRSFAQGKETAVDMGQSRLANKNGWIMVKKAMNQQCKYGFSVLIKTAGVYKLNDVTIIAGKQPDAAIPRASDLAVFYAACPLVVYSEGDGKIFAEDRHGRAAVIRKGALVWKRENPAGSETNCFSIEAFS